MSENDFVFLDDAQRPYRVKTWGGELWLFYWTKNHQWASLREVTAAEVAAFPRNLTQEQQALYMTERGGE